MLSMCLVVCGTHRYLTIAISKISKLSAVLQSTVPPYRLGREHRVCQCEVSCEVCILELTSQYYIDCHSFRNVIYVI